MNRKMISIVIIVLSQVLVVLSSNVSSKKEILYKECKLVKRAGDNYYFWSKLYVLTNECDTLDIRMWTIDSIGRIPLDCGINKIFGRPVRIVREEASPYEKRTNKCAIEIAVIRKRNCYVMVAFWHYITNYNIIISYDFENEDLIGYTEGYF